MDVIDIILADYAKADVNGKFTLVGAGFTAINARSLPCIHPLMFLLLRLTVTEADRGKNKIEILIKNAQVGTVFKAEANLDIPEKHKGSRNIAMPVQINHLKFPDVGLYQVEVMINGQQSKRTQRLEVHLNGTKPS